MSVAEVLERAFPGVVLVDDDVSPERESDVDVLRRAMAVWNLLGFAIAATTMVTA